MARFPFGAPVLPCDAEDPDRRYPVFLLGAHPSALHVRRTPPQGFGPMVAALPVDNEPTPFWDAKPPSMVQELFGRWHERYFQRRWGSVAPASQNGSSGRDIEELWLRPLGFIRDDAFITDCLVTARASVGVARRLNDRYLPVVEKLGAPPADLGPHPSEREIAQEAISEHGARLARQVLAADPDVVVTLGNAAARVIAALGSRPGQSVLRPDSYGEDRHVMLGGRSFCWIALVHPATPREWADRHRAWIATTSSFERDPQPGDTVIALDGTDDPTPTIGPA
jgi:hypothetical protein